LSYHLENDITIVALQRFKIYVKLNQFGSQLKPNGT